MEKYPKKSDHNLVVIKIFKNNFDLEYAESQTIDCKLMNISYFDIIKVMNSEVSVFKQNIVYIEYIIL